jgi:hypothetical protein
MELSMKSRLTIGIAGVVLGASLAVWAERSGVFADLAGPRKQAETQAESSNPGRDADTSPVWLGTGEAGREKGRFTRALRDSRR